MIYSNLAIRSFQQYYCDTFKISVFTIIPYYMYSVVTEYATRNRKVMPVIFHMIHDDQRSVLLLHLEEQRNGKWETLRILTSQNCSSNSSCSCDELLHQVPRTPCPRSRSSRPLCPGRCPSCRPGCRCGGDPRRWSLCLRHQSTRNCEWFKRSMI